MDNIRQYIQQQKELVKANISSQIGGVDYIAEELEKGKSLPEGTIREWNGERFQKRKGKWIYIGKKRQKVNPLNKQDKALLANYTSTAYREINESLRKGIDLNSREVPVDSISKYGSINPRNVFGSTMNIRTHVTKLNTALDKLPGYNNQTVYRRINAFANNLSPDEVAANYSEVQGDIIQLDAFTSTSNSKDDFDNWRKNKGRSHEQVLFEVYTKEEGSHGKEVAKYSSFPDESEVLFKSGTQFRVEGVHEDENYGVPVITLKEV